MCYGPLTEDIWLHITKLKPDAPVIRKKSSSSERTQIKRADAVCEMVYFKPGSLIIHMAVLEEDEDEDEDNYIQTGEK